MNIMISRRRLPPEFSDDCIFSGETGEYEERGEPQ
jgi:hypothetical protein